MAVRKGRKEIVSTDGGTAKIRKRIRDIERLLKRPNLASDKRVESERALKALNGSLETAQQVNAVRANAKKYHMVKFFEKKKATRRLKQAVKAVIEKPDSDQAKADLAQAETDLYYVAQFPLDKRYVSLYPNADAENSKHEREEFAESIRQSIKAGKLPIGLDKNNNSNAIVYVQTALKGPRRPQRRPNRPAQPAQPVNDSDNDNDHGNDNGDEFFES